MRLPPAIPLLLTLTLSVPALAQGNRPAPIESPVVQSNRMVTFRVRAPEARKVELSGQFLRGNAAMQKDEAGVWSVTVGPVEPNLYPYNFVVDGLGVADPANPDLTPEICDQHFPKLVDPAGEGRTRFKLLWLGVGKSDFLYPQTTAFNAFLTERKFPHVELVTEGGHTWMNARHYLAETLQLFFR